MARVSVAARDSLLLEVLEEETAAAAAEVYETDVVAERQRLEDTCRAVQVLVTGRFFRMWRNKYAGKLAERLCSDVISGIPYC